VRLSYFLLFVKEGGRELSTGATLTPVGDADIAVDPSPSFSAQGRKEGEKERRGGFYLISSYW